MAHIRRCKILFIHSKRVRGFLHGLAWYVQTPKKNETSSGGVWGLHKSEKYSLWGLGFWV